MNDLKAYLLSILLASLFCSILQRLGGRNGTTHKILRLLSGLFLTLTVLSPLITFELDLNSLYPDTLAQKAEAVAGEGTKMAQEETDKLIISKTEAYILDKAVSMGAVLEVEVTLHNHIPKSIRITGPISPGVKSRLAAWIQENLNVAPEELQWN